METYEIRVLTKTRGHGSDQLAALRRALALATPTEAIIEVWHGPRCVYAGNLAQVRFPE